MQIIIKTKNLELTPSLKNYINKRIEGLKKFVNKVSDIFVEVEKETLHHKKGEIFRTEALVHFPGKTLVAQAHGDVLFGAEGGLGSKAPRLLQTKVADVGGDNPPRPQGAG